MEVGSEVLKRIDERLENIERELKKQTYSSIAFLCYGFAMGCWGFAMSSSVITFFYVGFGLFGLGFLFYSIGLIVSMKKRQ